eukprot:scaffold332798_cov25-Prasinocladus_malaysianus.AAC.1
MFQVSSERLSALNFARYCSGLFGHTTRKRTDKSRSRGVLAQRRLLQRRVRVPVPYGTSVWYTHSRVARSELNFVLVLPVLKRESTKGYWIRDTHVPEARHLCP